MTKAATHEFAAGGRIRGGRATWWDHVTKYANGISRATQSHAAGAHGTVFVAGEAGPEIVGHVGGTTEVLNRSQLASTMYRAVLAAMQTGFKSVITYIGQTMANCTNAAILAVSRAAASASITVRATGSDLISTLHDIAGTVSYQAPAMAAGTVMPYTVAQTVSKSEAISGADLHADSEQLGQTLVQAIASATLSIVDAIQRYSGGKTYLDGKVLAETVINEINRQTRMYHTSPLIS